MIAPLLLSLLTAAPQGAAASPASAKSSVAKQTRVYVGMYLRDLSNFAINDGRIQADVDYWFKWRGSPELPPVRIANLEVSHREQVSKESDGAWHSVRWSAQGTLRGEFPLRAFPLDVQKIPVVFELSDKRYELAPDAAASALAERFALTGWISEPRFRVENTEKVYPTDLGSVAAEGQNHRVQRLSYSLRLERPFLSYLVKSMLPLAIILLMACMAFFLPARQIDVRAAIGVTALLSTIAFHFTVTESLPEVPYLLVTDKLFLMAYVLVSYSLVVSVFAANGHVRWPGVVIWWDRSSYLLVPLVAISFSTSAFKDAKRAQDPVSQLAASDQPAEEPAPRAESAQPELVVRVGGTSVGWEGLTFLGLARPAVDAQGHHVWQPHLLKELPQLTNDLVAFTAAGGMVITWPLKVGLQWADGEPITVADLEFSLEVASAYERCELETVDHLTLRVTCPDRAQDYLKPVNFYPRHHFAQVFEEGGKEAVKKHRKHQAPPEDGPYFLARREENNRAIYHRNPHFAGARPIMDRAIFQGGVTKGVSWAPDYHLVISASTSYAQKALNDEPGLQVVSKRRPMAIFDFLRLGRDLSAWPIDKKRRLLRGLDREAFVRAKHHKALAWPARDFRSAATDDDLHPKEAAGAMGTAAALGGETLRFYALVSRTDETVYPHDQLLRESLEELGFTVEIEPVAAKRWLELCWRQAEFDGLVPCYERLSLDLASEESLQRVFGHDFSEADSNRWDAWRGYKGALYRERRAEFAERLARNYRATLPTLPLALSSPNAVHVPELRGLDVTKQFRAFIGIEDFYLAPEGSGPAPGSVDAP